MILDKVLTTTTHTNSNSIIQVSPKKTLAGSKHYPHILMIVQGMTKSVILVNVMLRVIFNIQLFHANQ